VHAEHQVFSRSFMFTKPAYYNVVMQQALWHDIIYKRQTKHLGAFQITPFFQRSTTLNKSARYFLIDGKTSLFVSGDANKQDVLSRDIRAEWIGLPSNFQGTLSIDPKQQQYGFCLEYNQDLKKWFDVPVLRDMYVSIIAPVVSVHNNINLQQANIANPSPTPPQDIIQAFDQPAWKWGKMNNGHRRTELAEVRIMLGSLYGSENHGFQIDYNSILVIPVAKKQKAEFLFSPVVGNNHHMGVGAGVEFQIPLNRDQSSYMCSFILDLESVILIRNKQWRTFDLRGKEWSRFLLMNKQFGSQPLDNIPGVNLMTQRATVKPFNVVDFAMGWRWKTQRAEIETGWGVWGHGYERVEHINDDHPFLEPFGIAGTLPGTTAHNSTIAQHFPIVNDPAFVPITLFDFDPQSGANSGALNFRVFMSAGMIRNGATHDSTLGVGWSIDMPYKNSTLQVWSFWLKMGANF